MGPHFAALGFAAAFATTNVDNLAIIVALAPKAGLGRTVAAFLLTQALAITLAAAAGTAAESIPPDLVGWLGLVPIALGVRALLRRPEPEAGAVRAPRLPMAALVTVFAGLSVDTFALTAAFTVDSAERFDPAVLAGAAIAIAAIAAAAVAVMRLAEGLGPWLARLERLAPFVMIAAGVYILWDSVTDLV